MALSTTASSPLAGALGTASFLGTTWQGLRHRWAIRRTRLAIAELSESQLREIGLAGDDPAPDRDAHQRYWRECLGFTAPRSRDIVPAVDARSSETTSGRIRLADGRLMEGFS
ncbi:DUF1127 domain-containing protein [Microvirga alba]|uniref:DUF1127 domain-containing protein n=1 Tax=Microvirga alba TaxID=2791025 RepID=A0A931FN10_9HYPH|nr:hypothetical protein [Microvirga alba]MBF9233165.1 hypothetical protein [Microvirga alba]